MKTVNHAVYPLYSMTQSEWSSPTKDARPKRKINDLAAAATKVTLRLCLKE